MHCIHLHNLFRYHSLQKMLILSHYAHNVHVSFVHPGRTLYLIHALHALHNISWVSIHLSSWNIFLHFADLGKLVSWPKQNATKCNGNRLGKNIMTCMKDVTCDMNWSFIRETENSGVTFLELIHQTSINAIWFYHLLLQGFYWVRDKSCV